MCIENLKEPTVTRYTSPLHRLAVRLRHDACGKVCIMIHVPTVEPPPAEAFTFTFTFAFTEANSCTRKVATVLLDAMLLDLSRLGHNGLVHNAREDGGKLSERQPQV